MARSKTDYGMLRELPPILEKWCEENGLECKQHSQFHWNVREPSQHLIIAVYPGSGLLYLSEAHYENTKGVIDKTGQKLHFMNGDDMIKQLKSIVYAVDML